MSRTFPSGIGLEKKNGVHPIRHALRAVHQTRASVLWGTQRRSGERGGRVLKIDPSGGILDHC